MAIREIVQLGHPALRAVAKTVGLEKLAGAEVQALIDDMIETMQAAQGIGLAAPQMAVPLQIFVYGYRVTEAPHEPGVSLKVLVNPTVKPVGDGVMEGWEGCLSIPGLRGIVPRHLRVRVWGLDRDGREVAYEAEGMEARVIQHEYDHLFGLVFLDRMADPRALSYDPAWERFVLSTMHEGERGGTTVG